VRAVTEEVEEYAVWVRDGRGRILMNRESGSRRTGLWKLPLRDAGEVSGMREVLSLRYGITRYRVILRVYEVGVVGRGFGLREGDDWVGRGELVELPMAAPFRKAMGRLLQEM